MKRASLILAIFLATLCPHRVGMAQSKAGLLILFLVRGDSFVRTRTSRRCSALLPGPSAGQRHDIAGSATCAVVLLVPKKAGRIFS